MPDIYYKVLNESGISPTTEFDYSHYLPHDGKAGDWLPAIDNAKLREEGYYVSKYWNFWYTENARIYEVETRGELLLDDAGVEKQACCRQIRLLKDVTDALLPALSHNYNIGNPNSGERNNGVHNTGEFNIGKRNTGKLNLGDFNTGDSNIGIDNVGDRNRGSANSGSSNIGHSNTGDFNNGSYNSGSYNEGNSNSGNFNKGNRNTGKYNIGSYHTGHFNTKPSPAYMFNKPIEVSLRDVVLPLWLNAANLRESFDEATKEDAAKTLNLPNFDYDIFEKITNISKSDFDKKLR